MGYIAGSGGQFTGGHIILSAGNENLYKCYGGKIIDWKLDYDMPNVSEVVPKKLMLTIQPHTVMDLNSEIYPLKKFTNKQLTDELSKRFKDSESAPRED